MEPMEFFTRVGNIIATNLNDLFDGVGNSQALLEQTVWEMEAALKAAMSRAARVIANERLLRRQRVEQRRLLKHWRENAFQAVRSGDDERARFAIARRLEREKLTIALDDQLVLAASTNARLRREIEAMDVRLGVTRANLKTVLPERWTAESQTRLVSPAFVLEGESDLVPGFELLCILFRQAEAEAEALLKLQGVQAARWGNENDVEAELRFLKQQFENDGVSDSVVVTPEAEQWD